MKLLTTINPNVVIVTVTCEGTHTESVATGRFLKETQSKALASWLNKYWNNYYQQKNKHERNP
jgi:hypothetical protein